MINTLYRKYRPKLLKDVIGQEHITSTLIYSINNNKTHQSYIFSGIRGTGKTTLAKVISRAINCLNFKNDLCLNCENCLNSENSQCIDILELDAASNNGISEIRSIIENISYMPQVLTKKIYIIDEAHMLTNNAWNALLKTIEEPPKHICFIFATTEFHKIPLTILSRCQHFKLNRLSEKDINIVIDKVIKNENINLDLKSRKKIFRLSNGSARDCLTILEQLAIYSKNEITIDSINSLYGFVDTKTIISFIESIFLNRTKDIMFKFEEFQNKLDANLLVDELINVLIDLKLYIETNDKNILDHLIDEDLNLINENFSLSKIIKLIEFLYDLNKSSLSSDHKFFNLKILLTIFNNENLGKNNNSLNSKVENKMSINELKENKEFDLNNTFKTSEWIIESSINILDNNNNNNKISIKEIFTKIAHFNEVKELVKLNDCLRNIRQKSHYEEILKLLSLSNRFFVNHNNFSILLFESKIDADKFNKLYNKEENKKIICNNFQNENILIIALCFEEAKNLNNYAKSVNKIDVKKITNDEIQEYLNQLREEIIKDSILKLI